MTIASASHAQLIDDSRVRGPHDVTALIVDNQRRYDHCAPYWLDEQRRRKTTKAAYLDCVKVERNRVLAVLAQRARDIFGDPGNH